MSLLPTLRRELVTAFALVFAGALFVAAAGVLVLLPRFGDPRQAAVFVVMLLIFDIAVFVGFGHYLLRWRVLTPIERMIAGVEAISHGELSARLPAGGSQEMARLAAAVNQMAEHLLSHQEELAANIRSLNETNRLLTEARDVMIRSEKLASVGRLGAGIAHEVGNPLAAILGYLGILGKGADGRSREMLEAAEREARRIDRIVRGLLDYARPREARAEPMDVNTVIRETVELVRTQGQLTTIEVELALASELPEVRGDPYQLQQVLVNLLVNASDAIGEKRDGRLCVGTRARPVQVMSHLPIRRKDDPAGIDYSHRRRLAAAGHVPREDPVSESGWLVEITVADNGPGIAPALLDQIFDPFVTTKEPGKGTGLGLAVSTRLIETIDGRIRAENSPDGGAVFTILLPALPAAQSEGR
jgi:two-component system, NtrC family, sensor kinase